MHEKNYCCLADVYIARTQILLSIISNKKSEYLIRGLNIQMLSSSYHILYFGYVTKSQNI